MKKTATIIVSLLLQYFCVYGQGQTALPQITNYHSYEYRAGVQNSAIDQDNKGLLYFGNSEGLLTFDGRFWRHYLMPQQSIVRSVKVGADGKIYIGGQDQMGYFAADQQGRLQYHSLTQLLQPADKNFSDIWNVALYNNDVFFQSKNKIFQYKDGAIKTYLPERKWAYMGRGGRHLYAQEHGKGLVIYDNGIWKPACDHPVFAETSVTGMMEYNGDTLLVTTLKKGLFLLYGNTLVPKQTQIDPVLTKDRLYCSAKVNENWYALGTNSAGIFIVDKNGKLVQNYSYREGLQKNNVRSLLLDRNKNLWAGLDDGIDQLAINSPIKYIYPDKTKQVTGYATRIFDHKLYVGTSNGLYVSPVDLSEPDLSHSGSSFSEVGNTTGQVWNLEEVNDRLLIGHEDGCLVVNGNTAVRLYGGAGSWLFRPTTQVFPAAHILVGTYTGLRHFSAEGGAIADLGQLDGVNESLRFLALDDHPGIVWAAHPNRGIYRIRVSPDYSRITNSRLFAQKDGLPSNNGNYIYRVKNRMVATTHRGVFEFDPASDRFGPSKTLSPIFKDLSIQYLHEDPEGNIWFITNKKVGVVDFHKPSGGKNHSIVYFPELNGMALGGYESVYSWNGENIFIAGNKGIIHVNYKKYSRQHLPPEVYLGQVKATEKDSVLFGGYAAAGKPLRLGSSLNSLHFEYSSTQFDQQRNIEFSYRLEGFDRGWSAWSAKSEKDYTNLPPGEYTFAVKARNNLGNESPAVQYHFEVMRAWYNSYWTYSLYVCLLAGFIWLALRWQRQKHRKEQAHLNYLHQLELDRNEKEIIKLKNEKLETDISFKNRELLTMTVNLVQRGEVLTKIREIISSLIKKDADGESTPAFRNLLKLIREVEKSNEDWDQFAIHFNNVNFDFFDHLKQAYPDLTPNDLKLCAYLRMNLSSKEIAQLLNITLKAVEIARYRLRKKLQLLPDTNLTDFLTQLNKQPAVN